MPSFQQKYERFVSEHGELYEKRIVPMEEADRKRVKNYHLFIIFFLSFFAILFFTILYFRFPSTIEDRVYMVMLAAALTTGFTANYFTTRNTLAKNVKTVIKGVVTEKKRETRSTCSIKISNREKRNIRVPDYKKLELGDIVQLEILGNPRFIIITIKVILIGKLPS